MRGYANHIGKTRLYKHMGWLVGLMLYSSVSATPVTAEETQSSETFSKANQLLFMTPHLDSIKANQQLIYDLTETVPNQPNTQDTVTLDIALKDGHKTVNTTYLTGERNRWVPAMTDVTGNPIIMLFLQSDVYELAQLNGGQWRHYQKYIKLALEDKAETKPIQFTFHNQAYEGTEIQIQPYLNDPENKRFAHAEYINATYDFVLSDQVPGGIYKVAVYVPSATDPKHGMESKELVLR